MCLCVGLRNPYFTGHTEKQYPPHFFLSSLYINLPIYMYTCMYVCMYAYVCMDVYIYVYIRVCVYLL